VGRESRRLENQQTFRAANERQRERAGTLIGAGDPVPFLCECADPRCTQVLLLTLEAYGDVRSGGDGRFVVVPNHELVEGEVVVEAGEHFWVTEKPHSAQEQDAVESRGQTGG
jgi:hypothetical protein